MIQWADDSMDLLAVIVATRPTSLQELADRTGRKASNLSRTLRTMEHYGFLRLDRGQRGRIRPEVPYQGSVSV
jgi:predicted transcriptional regulator